MSLVRRLAERGVAVPVRALFEAPTPAGVATAVAPVQVAVPPNLIPARARQITPDMVTLAELTQKQIAQIVAGGGGGGGDVGRVYPPRPFQDSIVLHYT